MAATAKIFRYSNILSGDLDDVAEKIFKETGKLRVFAFEGEMGSGKTTLIKTMSKMLGVADHVTSPTFTIVNEYHIPGNGPVYHFDFYRIKSETEALDLGIENYLYSGNFCFLEWPDKIKNLLPAELATITITDGGDESREITLSL